MTNRRVWALATWAAAWITLATCTAYALAPEVPVPLDDLAAAVWCA